MNAPIIDVDENLRLLGTAHVATASVEAVRENISQWKPDIVAVELCKSRYDALTQDRRLDKEGLLKVIKEGKASGKFEAAATGQSSCKTRKRSPSAPSPSSLPRGALDLLTALLF